MSPVANKSSWQQVLENTDISFTICSYVKIEPGTYDIVIVDEAHNFKNPKSKSYLALFRIIKNCRSKVMLLSATPYQNRIEELRTMVSLIHFNVNTPAYLMLGKLFVNTIQNEKDLEKHHRFRGEIHDDGYSFQDIGKEVELRGSFEGGLKQISSIFATFSNQNTRELIKQEFSEDYELMGRFPTKHETTVNYQLCSSKSDYEVFKETIEILNNTPFCLQNMTNYIVDIKRKTNLGMWGLMRSFLLKRLDSSIYAFQISLDNMYRKLMTFDRDTSQMEVDGEVFQLSDQLKLDYDKDCINIRKLIELWKGQLDTKKLDVLFENLKRHTIVFTEYSDTLELIREEAIKRKLTHFIAFDGNGTEKQLERIRLNFDANLDSNLRDLDYVFTTDVLAEGVNLHVAGKVIHFDQKWNPSKVTQRNGRIDRILKTGTHRDIQIVYFKVDNIVEQILELEKRIDKKQYQAKMFIDHLVPIKLYTYEKFEKQKILFFPDEEYIGHYIAYRTYMGELLLHHSMAYEFGHIKSICFEKPETEKCIVSKINMDRDRMFYSEHFGSHIELSNPLYVNGYISIFKEIVLEKLKTIDKVNHRHVANEMIKMYDREEWEWCLIWFKQHKYQNWEDKF